MGVDQQVHRAGALKQTNKTHKTGRHRSKGAIDNELKGAYFVNNIFTLCSSMTGIDHRTENEISHFNV